jgi:hypothetical protein
MAKMNKIEFLKQAIDMLKEADYLQKLAYRDTDVSDDNTQRIEELIEDLEIDVMELESK